MSWSSLSVDMKEKLRTRLINSLKVNHMTVIVFKWCSLLSFIITQVPTTDSNHSMLTGGALSSSLWMRRGEALHEDDFRKLHYAPIYTYLFVF